MSNSCVKHPMTFGTQICGECGHHFCDECVVFPFGPKKAPLCISCALELGGVSFRPPGRPKLSRQSIRERRNSQRKARKLAQQMEQAATDDVPVGPIEADGPEGAPAQAGPQAPATPPAWIDDHESVETLPGGWSQTYR